MRKRSSQWHVRSMGQSLIKASWPMRIVECTLRWVVMGISQRSMCVASHAIPASQLAKLAMARTSNNICKRQPVRVRLSSNALP